MKQYPFFLPLFMILWLAACSPVAETAVQPTNTGTAPATNTPAVTETAVLPATVALEPTAAPTTTPTSRPTPDTDPYTLAREFLEQTILPKSEDWQVTLCDGEAAVLCIGDGTKNVGYAELNLYPLSGYDVEHPVRLVASQLPADPTAYTVQDEAAVSQALTRLAAEHLEVIQADRAITFSDDTFTPLPAESVQMGALPALAFGFMRNNAAGELQERYLNVAAFDTQFIYWFGINYDASNVSTFVSDTAVAQFIPIFHDIATRLPIHQPTPSALPEFIPAVSLSGTFPEGTSWSLTTDLPEAATAVAVFSQPTQVKPLTAEEAAMTAQKYGFGEPLYVEYRTGFSLEELLDLGMFVAFDGSRSLAIGGRPYIYNDTSHQLPGPDLSFAQAAPTAEQFLKSSGWLNFPYEMAESDQGEGVLFLPVVDGVLLSSPAYAVRVAADNSIATVFIYPQDDLSEVGHYPILTAEEAWQQVQTDPNQPGIFYQIDPPAMETAVTYPPSYNRLPTTGESGTVYNNIWVYRPLLAGDGPPIIQSSNYFRITGDPVMLEALASETDYLVKLTGTVQELSPGLQTLELTDWELVPDAGGLPMFFGQIKHDDDETYLVDSANRTTYLLPDAPADLPTERETIVAGLPETADSIQTLNWQEITVYPLQSETTMPTPTAPMQAVTVNSAKLVYLRMPAHIAGLTNDLYFPVWQFGGTADNGERVTLWVTAIAK